MVYFIYFMIMMAFVDTFSQLPIMSPFAQGMGASSLVIGMIIGMYSFTNIIGNMLSGIYIDRSGTKKMLTAGLLITGIILCAYILVRTPGQLLVVRFFHGFSGGLLVPAAFTYVANTKSEKHKGRTMALSGAAVGLASIIGPAFGGIVTARLGENYVFGSIGLMMIVTGVAAALLLKEKVPANNKKMDAVKTGFGELFKRYGLVLSYIGAFSLMFSQGILAYALPLKIADLGFDTSLSGILLSTFAIISTLIFVLPTNRLYDRMSYAITMMTGLTILGICLFTLTFVAAKPLLFSIMGLYGIGFALIFPSMTALVANNAVAAERGKAYGLFYGFFSLGVVAGSFVSGLFSETTIGIFTLGGCGMLLCVLVLWFLYGKLHSSRFDLCDE